MKKSWHLSRRDALRGLGFTLALPYLESMSNGSCTSDATEHTKAVFLYFPNGCAEGSWEPKTLGRSDKLVELNPWMKPLEPFRNDLVIPKNMWTPRGNGHSAGTATWLTGHGYDGQKIDAGGASVDQIAARTIGQNHLLPSLQLSLAGEGYFSKSLPRNNISWVDGSTPASREIEPRRVFDRIVGRSGGALMTPSVLDVVREDAKSMERQLGAADQQKLKEYLDSVRSLERRLSLAEKQSAAIAADKALTDTLVRPQAGIPADHEEYVQLMMDMIVLAFATDATRVCTFMLDHGQSNRYFNFVDGVKGTWHALSHYRDISGKTEDDDGKTSWSSRNSKRDMYNSVTRWHTSQVAYLLERLKSVSNVNGTLLEQSMVVYGSSLSDGHEHSAQNLPIVIAGQGGGAFRTGRGLEFRRPTSMSKLYLSMLQALGVKRNRFADADAPLTELHTA